MEPSALPQGCILIVRERSWLVVFPLPGNMQGWGQIEAGRETQVPKEQEAEAAEQELSSPCSAPHPEPPFPTQESKAPSMQEPLVFFCFLQGLPWSHSPLSPLANQSQHWWGGAVGTRLECPSHPTAPVEEAEEHQGLEEQGKLFVTHRFPQNPTEFTRARPQG